MNGVSIVLRRPRRRAFHVAAAACLTWSALGAFAEEPQLWPESLRRAIGELPGRGIQTSAIEFAYRPTGYKLTDKAEYFTWRSAGARFTQHARGDEDGMIVAPPASGELINSLYFQEKFFLIDGPAVWYRDEDSTAVSIQPRGEVQLHRIVDLRAIGVDPADPLGDKDGLLRRAAQFGVTSFDFEETREGDLEVVTARSPAGTLRWWIDPSRNWSIVRTATGEGDQIVVEMRHQLEQIDGVWFPRRVEFVHAGGSEEAASALELLHAEFNRPDHPQSLAPEDIGVEVGGFVTDRVFGRHGVWDGEKTVRAEDYFERVRAGELQPGRHVARNGHRLKILNDRWRAQGIELGGTLGHGPATRPTRLPDEVHYIFTTEWERYTVRFMNAHKLIDKQRAEAREVLFAAQRDAREFVDKRKSDIEEWQTDRDAAAAGDGREAGRRLEQLADRRRKLLGALDMIFESKLKRGLERIPTDEQRDAAKAAKPAGPRAAATP